MMTQLNQYQISVTVVNLFTRRRLAQAVLPALPAAGDEFYVRNLGYEVVNREWTLSADGTVEIVAVVQPQIDADGQRPFRYEEETELIRNGPKVNLKANATGLCL